MDTVDYELRFQNILRTQPENNSLDLKGIQGASFIPNYA